ncbi:MAG TPA: hypothetical protein VFG20_08745 [Planctomycetaceae bacterium]|jgi:hypothetical protein|nr:hypothetical protein [Planctomycetaceae bacterium]
MNEQQPKMVGTPSHWLSWFGGILLPSAGFAAALVIEGMFGSGTRERDIIHWMLICCLILSPCICLWAILGDPRTSRWVKTVLALMTPFLIVTVSFISIVMLGIIGLMQNGLEGTQ